MSLVQNRKNSALRVAFLTDSRFRAENEASGGNLKKRAIRCLMRIVRYPVVENSDRPDIVFDIIRQPGSKSWMLSKRKDTR